MKIRKKKLKTNSGRMKRKQKIVAQLNRGSELIELMLRSNGSRLNCKSIKTITNTYARVFKPSLL